MNAVKDLPANYHHQKTLDLSNSRTVLWLNLAAIPLLFLFGWLFSRLIILLALNQSFSKWVLGIGFHFFRLGFDCDSHFDHFHAGCPRADPWDVLLVIHP